MPAGLQIAQTGHALVQICLDHPAEVAAWNRDSNNLVVLQVPTEAHLDWYAKVADMDGLTYSAFTEPDMAAETTAIAFAPDTRVGRMFSNLPLAGKELATQ